MKKAVVTGAAGFIGGHLVQHLLDKGWEVIGIDNMSSGTQETMDMHLLSSRFRPIYLDVATTSSQNKISSVVLSFEPDYFFHLAAIPGVVASVQDPASSNRANITGLLNMLNLAKESGTKRFVFSSSSSVYGGSASFPTSEDSPLDPKSPYALQKKVGEEYCKMFSDIYNLETVSLRYFNVFGPRQRADSAYAAAISSFCDSVLKQERPIIYGDGGQTRDFCYVSNVVRANVLAALSPVHMSGDCFNVGCGGRISIKEVCNVLGTLEPLFEEERPGDVRHSQADISKAVTGLEYYPLISCKEGLEMTLEWFLREKGE